MTVAEARSIVRNFDENSAVTEADAFMFTEAMSFLIEKEKKPRDMLWLGGYYYDQRRFDLALKYYEMAASFDYDDAYECLGYIWYYGRTGTKDYKKAFEYFSRLMKKGHIVAAYKVADMYKNGYYVEADYEHYVKIIEKLYGRVKNSDDAFDPLPEVYSRLARIRVKQGRSEEAVELYLATKRFMAVRIRYSAFFGNMNIMKWTVDALYDLIDFDYDCFDFFDMYYLLKNPCRIRFMYKKKVYEIRCEREGEVCSVCFDGKWFMTRDDFFMKSYIGDCKLTSLSADLYAFEVIRNG